MKTYWLEGEIDPKKGPEQRDQKCIPQQPEGHHLKERDKKKGKDDEVTVVVDKSDKEKTI